MSTTTKPTCPWCNKKITKRKRINGQLCCRHCHKPVHEINGFFSTEKRPSLSVELWKHFAYRVSIKEGQDISLPEGSPPWIKELGLAIGLLKRCGGDIDIATETINQCFQHKSLAWKTRTSLLHCLGPDFRLAHATAKKVVALRRADEEIVARSMASSSIQVNMPTF